MAGRKKKAAREIPLEHAAVPPRPQPQAPPQLPPPPLPLPPANPNDPAAGLRGGPPPLCQPVVMMPDCPEACVNNVLVREIENPTPNARVHTPDPNITVLDEIAKGISQGTDINHVRDDALRIASHQPEKINMVNALLRGVDINRLNRFVQVRDQAEHALAVAAMRGDLKSTEYLAFLRMAANEIKEIRENLTVEEIMRNGGNDSAGMLSKMDHAQQAQEQEQAQQYKGTTPLGREIIRKQIHRLKTKIAKAGKLKKPKDPAKAKAKK
jgi:hypothetical protein